MPRKGQSMPEEAKKRISESLRGRKLSEETKKRISESRKWKGLGLSPGARPAQIEAVTTHGLSRHPLYGRWEAMMHRCFSPVSRAYGNYGGRGITVCDDWHDVRAYIEYLESELGPCPPGWSLDRIDNDGHYEPGNVRWATAEEQRANRRH
jgi:hypothetical protein